ncbi:molybdopterin-dependent oxidoreductase [Dyella mobilis]|uniref:Molybdopterin-dependent oxidoreductase n=1 Tax=Dyella mobilis TaxID=1849582 RepID=A0ABS2KE41_9GAMM|nr:molybdopterin-dependent oxidoreductase [Dyella mobilis]MBM7129163.1 molybdopterin-dependent oxidoreductase [Dyella mobilis]GLQ98457.1 hypothetical protein GCM10007863_28770 [Dyella mobilis]
MLWGRGCTSIPRWSKQYRHLAGIAFLLLGLALPVSFVRAQAAPTPASIRVMVEGKPPMILDRHVLAAMPRASVDTAAIHHEPPAHWQGVNLEDVLQRAGAPSGESLRGHGLATIVRVTATDHYQVVFSLGELDPMLGNQQVLLVDTQDGHPLAKNGPFRLVVPNDKRPARWIHDVSTIEVIDSRTATP